MPAIVTFLTEEQVYLLMIKEEVRGFESVDDALNYFQQAYNRNHARGYEASMSATLNFLSFQPSVHEWNHEDLSPLLEMKVIDLDNFQSYTLNHVSGRMIGARCTGENAMEFHKQGLSPSLIQL